MRFLAANNSNWNRKYTINNIILTANKNDYEDILNGVNYADLHPWYLCNRIKHFVGSKDTLIIYAELAWESPFNCPIYKISAELHVKEVENYSVKQAAHKIATPLKLIFDQQGVHAQELQL